ncbi:hypothetical protein GCM10022286_16260 [Gryllotalpicola daejeonensis]|uniref:Uncharacterized protein n=1 Tax=Gryllotalpicola daejeonensis TaxID=993087 RepID=A0ABP7ZK96_9MICO
MPGFRRYAATVAIFASGLYLALLIAAFGVISLLTGLDVIADARAGELAGPVATGAATLFMIGCLLLIALRIPESRQRIAPLTAIGIGVGAYLVWPLFAAIAYLLGNGDPVGALLFFAQLLEGPFAITVGVAAFVIALLYMLVLASRIADRGRPRWPWERDDDE